MDEELISLIRGGGLKWVPLILCGEDSPFFDQVKAGFLEIIQSGGGDPPPTFATCGMSGINDILREMNAPDFERKKECTLHDGYPWWIVYVGESLPGFSSVDVPANVNVSYFDFQVGGRSATDHAHTKWGFHLSADTAPYYADGRLAQAAGGYLAGVWLTYCEDPEIGERRAWGVDSFPSQRRFTMALVEEAPDRDYHRKRLNGLLRTSMLEEWLVDVEQALDVEEEPFSEDEILAKALLPEQFSVEPGEMPDRFSSKVLVVPPKSKSRQIDFIGKIHFKIFRSRRPAETLYRLRELRTWLHGSEGRTLQMLGIKRLESLLPLFQKWRSRVLSYQLEKRGFFRTLLNRSERCATWARESADWEIKTPFGLKDFQANETLCRKRMESVPSLTAGIVRLLVLWVTVGWLAYYAFLSRGLPVPSHWLGWGILGVSGFITLVFGMQAFLSRLFRERAFDVTFRDIKTEYLLQVLRPIFDGWKNTCTTWVFEEKIYRDRLSDLRDACRQSLEQEGEVPENSQPFYGDVLYENLFLIRGEELKNRAHTAFLQDVDFSQPGNQWLMNLDAQLAEQARDCLASTSYQEIEDILQMKDDQRKDFLKLMVRNADIYAYSGPVMQNSHKILFASTNWNQPHILERYDKIEVRSQFGSRLRLFSIVPIECWDGNPAGKGAVS